MTDRGDPLLAHLDGLNLSRAWYLRHRHRAARRRPGRKPLANAAMLHAAAALQHVKTGDYMGEHWLASFAVYLLSDLPGRRVDHHPPHVGRRTKVPPYNNPGHRRRP